jgi:hypothetical protein
MKKKVHVEQNDITYGVYTVALLIIICLSKLIA